jgi:hypothetical protein
MLLVSYRLGTPLLLAPQEIGHLMLSPIVGFIFLNQERSRSKELLIR